MKLVFLGTPQFAVPSLDLLADCPDISVAAVATHPDRPAGRHLQVVAPPVKLLAQKYNIPVYQAAKVSELADLREMDIDLIVVVSFGEILSPEFLALPRLGCINLHTSLLPKYRGAAPVAWAIINGEQKTGVTTFWVSPRMDAGNIILQKEVEILREDTRGTLSNRLAKIGAELLLDTVIKVKEDKAPRITQEDSLVTYAPKLKKQDGLIDWQKTAGEIHNKVRGMNPWPGAFTFFRGKRVVIIKADVVAGSREPGSVIVKEEEGIEVGTGKDILVLQELQVEGKKQNNAVDFVHGYRVNEGEKFGS